MADYPKTRCSQGTVYEGMDRFAATAAAWQQAEPRWPIPSGLPR